MAMAAREDTGLNRKMVCKIDTTVVIDITQHPGQSKSTRLLVPLPDVAALPGPHIPQIWLWHGLLHTHLCTLPKLTHHFVVTTGLTHAMIQSEKRAKAQPAPPALNYPGPRFSQLAIRLKEAVSHTLCDTGPVEDSIE